MLDDTIAAIATPPGRGGIGIVRLSGPDSLRIASTFFKPRRGGSVEYQPSHTARYGRVVDPTSGEVVDEAIVLVMRAPRSYTSEDVVEISCHGGPVPLGRTLRLALAAGARLAEPGEFTKRAFLNGRIDLAQAEAVCDLIEARTNASSRLALQQLAGRLSAEVNRIRDSLIALLASIDAGIDFPEHDIEEVTRATLKEGLESAREAVRELLRTAESGRVFREGVRAAIVGRPNVGKSSLMNALLGQERAIVTAIPGTTRDLIEETASIMGVPFVLTDTAGIRPTDDPVERIGVERAEEARKAADLTILVVDSTMELEVQDLEIIARSKGKPLVVVLNKVDLGEREGLEERLLEAAGSVPIIKASMLTGQGLDDLRQAMHQMVVKGGIEMGEHPVVTNARHQSCLTEAEARIADAAVALDTGVPYDLVSIDIRAAADALGRITGQTAGDDILEEIFSRFCIGK